MMALRAIAVACALTFSGLLASFDYAQANDLRQSSSGSCSPLIIGNSGHVDIKCPGLDAVSTQRLEDNLTKQLQPIYDQLRKSDDYERTIKNLNDLVGELHGQADEWAKKYRDLSDRLTNTPTDAAERAQAEAFLMNGEFEKAEQILLEIADTENSEVLRAAATQHDLGDLDILRFAPSEALAHFKKAFLWSSDNPSYAFDYGMAAYAIGNFGDAESGLKAALNGFQALAEKDPLKYKLMLSETLNDLGIIYRRTNRPDDAVSAFGKSLAIQRELANRDPVNYKPHLAKTLGNLAILYRQMGKYPDSERSYQEALSIICPLADQYPSMYRSGCAMLHNNMGVLYVTWGRANDAEENFKEAIEMLERAPAIQPDQYAPYISAIWFSLAEIYRASGDIEKAKQALDESKLIHGAIVFGVMPFSKH